MFGALAFGIAGAAAHAAPASIADAPTTVPVMVAAGDRLMVGFLFDPPTSGDLRRVMPGDRLAFALHFGWPDPEEPYQIQPGDELYLSFRYSPELSRLYFQMEEDAVNVVSGAYLVQPDGTIVLRAIQAPLRVLDRTTTEVAALVHDLYQESGLLEQPELNVAVNPQFERQETLRALFQPVEERPVSFMTQMVPSDGRVGLPLVSGFPVAGRTLGEIGEELTERYRAMRYPWVTVTAWFESVGEGRHEQLRELLAGHNPLAVTVRGDGAISLPLAPGVRAAGQSLEQLGDALTAHYQRLGYERLRVTLWESGGEGAAR